MNDARLRAVTSWASPEMVEDIGAQMIADQMARTDAADNDLTIVGAVDVNVLDARVDTLFPDEHPTGLPFHIRAQYLAVEQGAGAPRTSA